MNDISFDVFHEKSLVAVESRIPLFDRIQWRARGVSYGSITKVVATELAILRVTNPDLNHSKATDTLRARVKRELEYRYSSIWLTLAIAIALKIIEILIAEWWQ